MLQELLFAPPSDWKPPRLDDLPDWTLAKRVGIDIETNDPGLSNNIGPGTRHGGYICGVSFSIEDGETFYLPTRHLGGDNLDEDKVLEYLRHQSKHFKGTLAGANLNYDLDYLAEVDVNFKSLKWQRDVQIADPLIDELQLSYSLDNIAKRWGLPGKDEEFLRSVCADYKLKKPKGEMWKLPARYVAKYAEWDAALPLKILRKQERSIEDEELWDIYNLESRVQPVLLKLRRRGVKIDLDKLDEVEKWSKREETKALKEVKRLTGVDVPVGQVWKAEVMAAPLRSIGVEIRTDAKGKPSVDQALMASCGEVGALLMKARKVNKLRTTFAQSIRNHIVGDRIHCTFNQLRRQKEDGNEAGARYGRLSSEHPNLQQQPARDEFATMWRSIYIPDDKSLQWMCNDYSQQEPRWLTHYAEIMKMPGAHEAAEKYRNDPDTDNHKMMTEIVHPGILETDSNFKEERTACKQIYLGLCYGMGGAKLSTKLGLPTAWGVYQRGSGMHRFPDREEALEFSKEKGGNVFECAGEEAQEKLDKFNTNAPYVKGMAKKAEEIAKMRGYIVTALGRHCRFPRKKDGTYDWTHKALNRLIQGSSADQTKKAMVDLDDAGYTCIQLQVHDELDGGVESREQAEEIAKIMRDCVPMNVPSKVDVELGPNWGEVK